MSRLKRFRYGGLIAEDKGWSGEPGPLVGALVVSLTAVLLVALVCWLMSSTGDDYIDHYKPPMLGR